MHAKKLKWLSLFPIPHFGLFGGELVAYTGGTCFRPQVHERVGISLAEVHERIGKSVISVRKNVFNKGVRNIFQGVAKFYPLTLGKRKVYHLSIEGISKTLYKRVRG